MTGVREAADTARALVEDLDVWLSDQPDEETRAARTQTQAILAALGPLVAAAERAEEAERALEIPRKYDVLVSEWKTRAEAAEAKADTLEAALANIAASIEDDDRPLLTTIAWEARAALAAAGGAADMEANVAGAEWLRKRISTEETG